MLYSCTHVATVGVKGLNCSLFHVEAVCSLALLFSTHWRLDWWLTLTIKTSDLIICASRHLSAVCVGCAVPDCTCKKRRIGCATQGTIARSWTVTTWGKEISADERTVKVHPVTN